MPQRRVNLEVLTERLRISIPNLCVGVVAGERRRFAASVHPRKLRKVHQALYVFLLRLRWFGKALRFSERTNILSTHRMKI
jgi:hypothetical protein